MSTALSHSDLSRIRETQDILLSPLVRPDTDDWPDLACQAVRNLIGADHATLYSTHPAPAVLHTTLDEESVREYTETFVQFDVATPRALRLGRSVGHVLDVVRPEEFYGSALYHEYAVPRRIFDPMLLHARPEPELTVWITAPNTAPLRAGEIERRRRLLELAAPAFAAGAASYVRLGRARGALGRVLDGITTPLLLCDLRGRPLHENAALRRALADEAERDSVTAALRQLAAGLGPRVGLAAGEDDAPLPASTGVIRTAVAAYHVTATISPEGVLGPNPMVILQFHVEPASLPALDDLRSRFALTRREAEVCVLLAGRLTNREIAEQLSISPHTAERHTERVLQKLGIHARADVRKRLEGR